MKIVLNTGESYKLSELAKAVENSPDDLFYIVKNIDGKEVSFAITREQLISGISGGGLNNNKSIIYGGFEWSGTGLVFQGSEIKYNYYGIEGIIPPTTVTLDDGDNEDRFDIIAANITTDEIVVIRGTPSTDPIFPEVPEELIAVQSVNVKANSTTPDITQLIVYRNNVEWVGSTLGSITGTVAFDADDVPFIGSTHIRVANCTRSAIVVLTSNAGNINFSNYPLLTFRVRMPSSIPANTSFIIRNRRNGNNSGTAVNVTPLGFKPGLSNTWQLIAIPTAMFNSAWGNSFSLQMQPGNVNLEVDWDIDNVVLSDGSAPTPPPTTEVGVEKNGEIVGSQPKLNFIEGTNTAITVVDDPVNDRVNVTITAAGGGSGGQVDSVSGTLNEIKVTGAATNPIVGLAQAAKDSLALADASLQPGDEFSGDYNDLTNQPDLNGLIKADGSVAATAPLTGLPGTDPNHLATVSQLGAAIQKEEEIKGTAIYNGAMTGTVNLDLATFADLYGILTGNTIITVSNTPASGESFVRSATIKSTATESLTLPVGWKLIGEYKADGSENDLEIKFTNYPTVGLKVLVYINEIP